MKRYIIPFIAAAAVLLAGCNEIENAVQPVVVPDGEMIVNLAVDGPMGDPAVRSYVEGTENDISSIDLLCFDNEGKFITERVATLTPDETTPATKGRLNATVPANTCRIHFVANYNGLDLSGFGMGSLERTMMKSEALSSGITDEVRFWGYHSEATAGAMKTWLSAGTNKVWLLRDRAKVVLKNEDSNIKELAWTIGNGFSRGYVAPLCVSGNNPYANSYVTSTRLTEYAGTGAKYATMTDTDAIWAAADEPQFLFENGNTQGDPVKVIIRAKYADDADPVYHTVLLQDNTNKTYPVKRNETFTLTVKNLPESVGKGSLEAALATTDYSNNPYAQVAREVDEVNSEQFTLRVENVVKMYNPEDVVTIDGVSYGLLKFYYTAHDSGSLADITKDNFDLSWEAKSSDDQTDEVVAEIESGEQQGELKAAVVADYSASTGEGTIRIPLATLTADLKHSSLQIIAKNSGLSRFADLYSITAFAYSADPDLEYNNSTRPVGGSSREVYKLTFTLPENYPAGLYPVHVKLYTSTLVPFSDDKNNSTTATGSFDVVVADTDHLEQSAQTADWNYGAKGWDQYYDYVIPSPSSSSNREYTIYLYDITGNFSRNIANVGLYFQIDGFGTTKSLSANLPYKTVTFVTNGQDGNFPNGTNSKPIDDITLTFANNNAFRERANGYLELNDNSTFTVSSSAGNITSITINYTDYDHGKSGRQNNYSSSNPATTSGTVYATNNGTTGTWSGNSNSITFTMRRASNQNYTRIASIVVKYK